MNKGILVFAAMVLLQGCAQPALRYQPPEGAGEKYYANVVFEMETNTSESRGVLISQLRVLPHASGAQPSLRVNLERLQFEMTDGEDKVIRFNSLTDEEQILAKYQETITEFTQRPDGGHDVVSNSHFPIDTSPFTVVSPVVDELSFSELVALLPPTIDLKLGAMLSVQQGDLQFHYEVIGLTSERATLRAQASLVTELDKPVLTGRLEYEVSTGVLKEALIYYRFNLDMEAHVEVLIALNQRNDTLPTNVEYTHRLFRSFADPELIYWREFTRGVVNQPKNFWPLYEATSSTVTRVVEDIPEVRVFNTDDPLAPIQVRFYDSRSGLPRLTKLHEVSIDDIQGSQVTPLKYSEYIYTSQDEWGIYKALDLHPGESFDKGVINLTYTTIRDKEVKLIDIPLSAGEGFYQEKEFQVIAEQVGERTWQVHVTKESNAMKERLEPHLLWGFNYADEHIESLKYLYPSEPTMFEVDGIPPDVVYRLNRDFSFSMEVTFTQEITQELSLYLEYYIPTELHYRIPTEALIGSVADYPPMERLVEGNYMAKETPFTPLISTELFDSLSIYIPRMLDAECDLKELAISNVSARGWLGGSTWQAQGLNHRVYRSNANKSVWRVNDEEFDVDVHCPEYRATELVPQQDYIQEKPWLITLTSEFAALPASQMLEELRVFNEEGREIHWVIPEHDADFSFPTMKAWGSIASIVHVTKTGEEVIYRHRPDFTEDMHPMERK
uniref:hypothetical protein n=1 Tax=Thaumasiovibrio occultus TaxID=1891184 RepID=UPI000B35551F|nr:hypothetical protein [Thaumasiovibrio occultus]